MLERTVSVEERIKRAEEIYQRRKMKEGVRVPSNTVNIGNRPDLSLFKRTILKIIICTVLYFVLYFIKNSNYIFSSDIINKTNQILSYDMNIQVIYNDVSKYFENLLKDFQNAENQIQNSNESKDKGLQEDTTNQLNEDENKQTDENGQVNEDENKQSQENESNQVQENTGQNQSGTENEENQESTGVGGADEQINISSSEQMGQMELDAKYINDNFEIILPLKSTVTSRFGIRTPTEIVSANHAGIDIGADEGAKIVAAMDGKVSLVSEIGDYGKHLEIKNGEVTTLYAHCKTIYVKEGEEIKSGTEIAEVGQTGRATRPTFTFWDKSRG